MDQEALTATGKHEAFVRPTLAKARLGLPVGTYG